MIMEGGPDPACCQEIPTQPIRWLHSGKHCHRRREASRGPTGQVRGPVWEIRVPCLPLISGLFLAVTLPHLPGRETNPSSLGAQAVSLVSVKLRLQKAFLQITHYLIIISRSRNFALYFLVVFSPNCLWYFRVTSLIHPWTLHVVFLSLIHTWLSCSGARFSFTHFCAH